MTFGALFGTGATWFLLHDGPQLLGVPSVIEEAARPTLPWLMSLHGAAAMLGLLLLGSLGPQHIGWAWKARTNRLTGTIVTLAQALLVVSGYLLYYAGGEDLRFLARWSHLVPGFVLPSLIAWHVIEGRRARQAVRAARQTAASASWSSS